jgi:hypothetical protein
MGSHEIAARPLVVLRLRGTQVQMGAQHGALLRELGGYEGAARFYPHMASRMLALGAPPMSRRLVQHLSRAVLAVLAHRMCDHRRARFPEYTARTQAVLAAGGVPARMAANMLSMEVLQNAVGLLGRAGVLHPMAVASSGLAACSSLAVWESASAGGSLRHARTFDFPGVGVWDEAPVLVFCEPDDGLRYGFVTTRGVDAPGITAFNEAGLTLTVHTRFHKDVRFDKPPVFDLGHEIVRKASTLREATDVARAVGASSTWGLLVSSAAERSACLIETTGEDVAVSHPAAGDDHLSCTNRYHSSALARREVTTSAVFVVNSKARRDRLESAVRDAPGGISAEDLQALLGDFGSPEARDRSDATVRLTGDAIASPMTVKSIVAEPERRVVRVSIGRAPTGFGPYVEVPWSWDGPVGSFEPPVPASPSHAMGHRGRALSEAERDIARDYAELARRNLEGESPEALRARLDDLVRRAPSEPHFRTLAAYLAMAAGTFAPALAQLEAALSLEDGEFRRARLLLYKTRLLVVLGRPTEADAARRELLAMSSPVTLEDRNAARAEARRPCSPARLRRVIVDFHLVDGVV